MGLDPGVEESEASKKMVEELYWVLCFVEAVCCSSLAYLTLYWRSVSGRG